MALGFCSADWQNTSCGVYAKLKLVESTISDVCDCLGVFGLKLCDVLSPRDALKLFGTPAEKLINFSFRLRAD